MSKVVLLTGGAGALGQRMQALLQEAGGYEVVAPGHAQCDIRDAARVAALLDGTRPDFIFNLAATFSADPDEAYATNVHGPRILLERLEAMGSPARVVLIGSAAEYGLVRPDENPVAEDRVLKPVSIYGMTKAWQTQLASVHAARGVNVVVARVFNLLGTGLSARLFVGRLQAQVRELLAGARSVIEVGPLGATRDYIPMDDAVAQLLAIAAHGEAGAVYNVASGRPVTMRDVMARILKEHDIDPSVVREGVELSNRVGYDVPAIYADMTRTMQLPGYRRPSADV